MTTTLHRAQHVAILLLASIEAAAVALSAAAIVVSFSMDRVHRPEENWVLYDMGTALQAPNLGLCFRFMPRYLSEFALFKSPNLHLYFRRFVPGEGYGFIKINRHARHVWL